MVLKCTKCEIVIETSEEQVYGQMVAHMFGTHGIRIGEGDLKPKAVVVEHKPIAKIEQPVRTFISKKAGRKFGKR